MKNSKKYTNKELVLAKIIGTIIISCFCIALIALTIGFVKLVVGVR